MVLDTPGLKIVGAADTAADLAGHDLGAVLGLPRRLGVKVQAEPEKLVSRGGADLAVVCTTSSLAEVSPLLLALVKKGLHVASTCEELAFPVPAAHALAAEIDKAARAKKVAVLGTGVNPGFAMDTLALLLTAPCSQVERVSVTRVVDAATRRLPLQRKVGAGLSLTQFRRAIHEGGVRHVGLAESAHMIAAGLGWALTRIEENVEPAVAPRDLDTEHLRIPAGSVSGIRQSLRAWRGDDLAVGLDLQIYVGAESPRDHVIVVGTPGIDMTIAGGIAGDQAAAAVLVNAIPKLMASRPGLVSMKDLPLVHRFNLADLKEALKRG
jgi:4-hydroxy-tetrahydrodipicolinate reductase